MRGGRPWPRFLKCPASGTPGQICVPWPGGRLRLAHIRWTYVRGLYPRPGGVMHLSAGLGTTFVPFRFLARPEATELVLVESN